VGEAGDGKLAIASTRALLPGIVLMDISMRARSSLEATRAIRTACPATARALARSHPERVDADADHRTRKADVNSVDTVA
jgi:DNA-binding NarL/FixJ family response regulator